MSDTSLFLLVAGFSSLLGLWSYLDYSRNVRIVAVVVIALVFGSLLLTFRTTLALIVVLTIWTATIVIAHSDGGNQLTISGAVMSIVVAIGALVQARQRDALGLRRRSPGSVLEQMRDRVNVQGNFPTLPTGWHANVAERASSGAAFAGDFVSARLMPGPGDGFLEVVVVDVSGSGLDAGPRALLLSGAIGGLLGAVAPSRLLSETNSYVLRQRWRSGFATASYLRIDLDNFSYELRSAGHPPAVIWNNVTRTVERCHACGTVLGVLSTLEVQPEFGLLAPGNALIIYTDGVVESRDQELDDGIDRLSARIDTTLRNCGPEQLADQIVDAGNPLDDRTVVVLWNDRSPVEHVTHVHAGGESCSSDCSAAT